MRYIKGEFHENYNVTVGVEFATKMVSVDNGNIARLQIWDTVDVFRYRQDRSSSGP